MPYGLERYEYGSQKTDYRFTGQRIEDSLDLYFYNARWYDPVVGRFIQADTVVPEAGNPQNLNRYTYVLNNPLRYIDPTGHIEENEQEEANAIVQLLQKLYEVYINVDWGWKPGKIWEKGLWELSQLKIVQDVLGRFAEKAGGAEGVQKAIGGVKIHRAEIVKSKGQLVGGTGNYADIWLSTGIFNQPDVEGLKEWGPYASVAHEIAHTWDFRAAGMLGRLGVPGISWQMAAIRWFEPGPTKWAREHGVMEDWADSVVAYLIPEYIDVQKNINPRFDWGLKPLHLGFIAAQFDALYVK